jgi:Fic family protein
VRGAATTVGATPLEPTPCRPDLCYRCVIPSFAYHAWIYRARFQVVLSLADSPVGTLVPIRGFDGRFDERYETHAFIPDDLPCAVDLPGEVWLAVTDAMAELGRLDAAASLIPNPQLVTRVATRREAIGTSALEGTFANLTDLFAAEVLPLEDQTTEVPPNVREVMNYTRAADAAYSWVKERPITIGMISALQSEIVRGTEADGLESGTIRQTQVFIGAKNRRISDARFVPPPPSDQLRDLYERWQRWLTDPRCIESSQLLVRIALAHYQFEAIHPYTDGNGRLGRLVAVLQLLREGALRAPVLSVSPWLKDNASEYRDHLLAISRTGDWAPWVEFFAHAVAAQARDGQDRIMRLLALRAELGDLVRSALPRARLAVEITDDLIAFPILTVASAQARYGRTNQANRNAVNSLVELGVLEPYSETKYDRLYWSRRVLQLIET